MRLPLVPTAIADSWAGWFLMGGPADPSLLAYLAIFSGSAYAFGMVLNDLADVASDRTEHPERPLPSRAVSRAVAVATCGGLMSAAFGLGFMASAPARALSLLLLTAIAAYNTCLKRWRWTGALGMGICRALNLLFGSAATWEHHWGLDLVRWRIWPAHFWQAQPLASAAGLGLYVATVTLVSSGEAVAPHRAVWVRRLLLGLIPLDALLVLAGTGDMRTAGIVLALLVPRLLLGRLLPVN